MNIKSKVEELISKRLPRVVSKTALSKLPKAIPVLGNVLSAISAGTDTLIAAVDTVINILSPIAGKIVSIATGLVNRIRNRASDPEESLTDEEKEELEGIEKKDAEPEPQPDNSSTPKGEPEESNELKNKLVKAPKKELVKKEDEEPEVEIGTIKVLDDEDKANEELDNLINNDNQLFNNTYNDIELVKKYDELRNEVTVVGAKEKSDYEIKNLVNSNFKNFLFRKHGFVWGEGQLNDLELRQYYQEYINDEVDKDNAYKYGDYNRIIKKYGYSINDAIKNEERRRKDLKKMKDSLNKSLSKYSRLSTYGRANRRKILFEYEQKIEKYEKQNRNELTSSQLFHSSSTSIANKLRIAGQLATLNYKSMKQGVKDKFKSISSSISSKINKATSIFNFDLSRKFKKNEKWINNTLAITAALAPFISKFMEFFNSDADETEGTPESVTSSGSSTSWVPKVELKMNKGKTYGAVNQIEFNLNDKDNRDNYAELLGAISTAESNNNPDAIYFKRGKNDVYLGNMSKDLALKYLSDKTNGMIDASKGISNLKMSEIHALQNLIRIDKSGIFYTGMKDSDGNYLNSSAFGKYQIVGKTLWGSRDKKGEYHPGVWDLYVSNHPEATEQNTIFNEATQDELGYLLLKSITKNATDYDDLKKRVAKTWESFSHKDVREYANYNLSFTSREMKEKSAEELKLSFNKVANSLPLPQLNDESAAKNYPELVPNEEVNTKKYTQINDHTRFVTEEKYEKHSDPDEVP